ncbi:hypothetical protein GCM10023321_84860 [Pseudonocardia eucalypti]|uniref:Uncharacterized protein n=1 Tax=Pseudonocardia eucalypti TaxID=648755 RepID=A0ABP9RFD0_9PSEU|nr:hypothetical protein [Pseudonocardia eucalypti]
MSPPNPAALVGVLVELERTRAAVLDQLERATPELLPTPDGETEALHELLTGARRAVLGNPSAARALYRLLAEQGRRYAGTPAGAELRDRLAGAPAVDHLRRIWELVTLNVLDGPAPASGLPDAWAELLAEIVAGGEVDEAVLARLRPEGFA